MLYWTLTQYANKIPIPYKLLLHIKVDICALTKSWIKELENDLKVPLVQNTYLCHSAHRQNCISSGVALVYKENFKIAENYPAMECTDYKFIINGNSLIIDVVCRLDKIPPLTFIAYLITNMQNSITNRLGYIIVGDFNIHRNIFDNQDLLDCFHVVNKYIIFHTRIIRPSGACYL